MANTFTVGGLHADVDISGLSSVGLAAGIGTIIDAIPSTTRTRSASSNVFISGCNDIINNPTAKTEDLYIKSINLTVDQYRAFLETVRTDTLVLPNCDFDSGKATKPGEYSLTDEAYAKLLAQLAEWKFDRMTPELRDNILQFYSDLSLPIETKKDRVRRQGVLTDLEQLRSVTLVPTVAGSPAE